MLRDSLVKIALPPEYRLNDTRSGINGKDKEQAAILARSGRYIGTGLKLVGETQRNWGDWNTVASLLDNTLLCLAAHMRYVQEEYTSLQV